MPSGLGEWELSKLPCCLPGEPFADVSFGGAGVGGQLGGCERSGLGQCPEGAEFVAEDHVAGRDGRAEVVDEAVE
jgi:hypothetical protein